MFHIILIMDTKMTESHIELSYNQHCEIHKREWWTHGNTHNEHTHTVFNKLARPSHTNKVCTLK